MAEEVQSTPSAPEQAAPAAPPSVRPPFYSSQALFSDRPMDIDAEVHEVTPERVDADAENEVQNIDELETEAHQQKPVDATKQEAAAEPNPLADPAKLAQALNLDPVKDKDTIARIQAAMNPQSAEAAEDDVVGKALAELQKDLLKDETAETRSVNQPVQPLQQQQVAQPAGSEKFGFGDIGDGWKGLDEGYKALSEAMDAGNPQLATEIGTAITNRQVMASMPFIAKLAEVIATKQIEQQLGAFKPILTRVNEQEMDRSAQTKAEKVLKEKLGDTFSEMMRSDGKGPVIWEGEEMDAIPYNRIVSEFPHIAKITEQHANPATAKYLTWIARYGEAARLYSKQKRQLQTTAKVASTVAKASAESGAKVERDKARQTANAGSRTNGKIGSSESGGDRDLMEMLKRHGPGRSVSSLFK